MKRVLGEALGAAEAAFLQDESEQRGIAAGRRATPQKPARTRRQTMLIAAVGAVGVMYAGRAIPRALRGALAIAVGLLLYAMLVPEPAMENDDDPREGRKESGE